MTLRKDFNVYMEDIYSLNIKLSDMLQKHLNLTDTQVDEVYNKSEEILEEFFEWPDYRHHM